MLERLTPAERVVSVLREGFDQSFADIAGVLDVSEDAARQRLRRAKKRLAGQPLPEANAQQENVLLDRLLMAVAEDDVQQLVSLLHEDAVAFTDGGGVVSAAIIPVSDPQRIAQVTMHLVRKSMEEGGLEWQRIERFGSVMLVIRQHGSVHSVTQIAVRDGLVHRVFVLRNPEKLGGV